MAMIPDTFVPSVTTQPIGASPMSAQPVQPMQNRAPEQQIQAGQTVQKLGEEVNNIGERIQYQLDDTMTKQAETNFLQQAQTIAYGDGKDNVGYLHTLGEGAVNALPDAQAALAKAKQDGLDSLANPYQKMMYNRVASQHLASFGTQFADHHFQQQTQWSVENSLARANTYSSQASLAHASYGSVDAAGNPTGEFATAVSVAEQETLKALHDQTGAPLGTVKDPGSAKAVEALLLLHTHIADGTIVNMLSLPTGQRPSYERVQQIYDKMKADGWVNSDGQKYLGPMVEKYSKDEQNRIVVNQQLSDFYRAYKGQPTTTTGTPNYSSMIVKGGTVASSGYDPTRGNVIISVPTGSKIQTPASGIVTQSGLDADGNFSMKIEHPDKSVTTLTGLQAANVSVGDKVVQGDNVGTTGVQLDNSKPGVAWSLTDSKGKAIDPTAAGLAPVDLQKITDEGVLNNALDGIRKEITDPVQQAEAVHEAESLVRQNQGILRAQKEQISQQASDAYYTDLMKTGIPNWKSIPTATWVQLNPQQQYEYKHAGEKGKSVEGTDENNQARYWLATHPFFDQADVNRESKYLSPSQVIEYATQAAKRLASGEDKNVPIDHYEFDNSMVNAGLEKTVHTEKQDNATKIANQELYVRRHDEVQQILNDAAAAQKGPLNQTQKNKLTDDYLSRNPVMLHKPGMFTRDSSNADDKLVQFGAIQAPDIPKAYVTVGDRQVWLKDIPVDQAEAIRKGIISNGESPTWQAIAWHYVDIQNAQRQRAQQKQRNQPAPAPAPAPTATSTATPTAGQPPPGTFTVDIPPEAVEKIRQEIKDDGVIPTWKLIQAIWEQRQAMKKGPN